MARRRPSAFEVSFPAEAAAYVAAEAVSRTSSSSSENHLKRLNGESDYRVRGWELEARTLLSPLGSLNSDCKKEANASWYVESSRISSY